METYRVSVPLAAIPLWVLAVVWLVSALFALAYWRSLWENVARPVVAVTFIGSLYAMATALILRRRDRDSAGRCDAARGGRTWVWADAGRITPRPRLVGAAGGVEAYAQARCDAPVHRIMGMPFQILSQRL